MDKNPYIFPKQSLSLCAPPSFWSKKPQKKSHPKACVMMRLQAVAGAENKGYGAIINEEESYRGGRQDGLQRGAMISW